MGGFIRLILAVGTIGTLVFTALAVGNATIIEFGGESVTVINTTDAMTVFIAAGVASFTTLYLFLSAARANRRARKAGK
jgi:EamA domain-containing membrane protein RarD